MSMNVNPDYKGKRLPSKLIQETQKLAALLKVKDIIGSFRPDSFGAFKQKYGPIDFSLYCQMKNEKDLPIDGWLRNLTINGMQPLAVDNHAMTIEVSEEEFIQYQGLYHQGQWQEVAPNNWECGEVGSWQLDTSTGMWVYIESNLWGRIPVFNSSQK